MPDLLTDEFFESATESLVEIANQTSNEIINILSKRIENIGTLTPGDVQRLKSILVQTDLDTIEKIIAKQTKKSFDEIDKIFEEVAKKNEQMYLIYYDYMGLDDTRSTAINRIITASAKSAKEEYLNLSRAFSLTLDKKVTPLSIAYNKIIDKAVYQVVNGTTDYFSAMRSTIKEISKNGVVIDGKQLTVYKTRKNMNKALSWNTASGRTYYTRRLDSSVRMNILDGARQMSLNMLNQAGKEFGADGVEISAHGLCREDHQAAQGHIYSLKEFEELQGKLQTPIATGEFNCGHIAYPVILNVANPTHSQSELDKYINSSNDVVEFEGLDGETLKKTRYEASQYQRRVETKIRSLKEQANALENSGDNVGAERVKKKARKYAKAYRKQSNQAGLDTHPKRLRVWT